MQQENEFLHFDSMPGRVSATPEEKQRWLPARFERRIDRAARRGAHPIRRAFPRDRIPRRQFHPPRGFA